MSSLRMAVLCSVIISVTTKMQGEKSSYIQERHHPRVSLAEYAWLSKRDSFRRRVAYYKSETVDNSAVSLTNVSVIRGQSGRLRENTLNCIINNDSRKGQFLLNRNIKLAEITLSFNNRSINNDFGHMFKPDFWTITTGKHGRGLLMLRHTYPILSMYSLSIGVEKTQTDIIDSPSGCLIRQNATDIENGIRHFILKNVVVAAKEDSTIKKHVCNMNILARDSYAIFSYICCDKTVDGDLTCKPLEKDTWLEVLLMFIFILKYTVFLFCPLLVPEVWYRSDLEMSSYTYLPEKKTISFTLVKRTEKRKGEENKCVGRHKFQRMRHFDKTLESLKTDQIYILTVSSAILDVKSRRLINESHVPVNIRRSIYRRLFRCKVRDYKAMKECCRSNVLGKTKTVNIPWFKCLQHLMNSILIVLALVPWVIRLAVFYKYEQDTIDAKQRLANKYGLQIPFEGNSTLFLKPLHSLFIIVYTVILFDSVLFGVLRKEMKDKCSKSLQTCLCDVSKESRYRVFGWATQLMLQPFEWYGIGGIVLGPFLWIVALPLCTCVVVVRMVPLINLTFQLFTHLFGQITPDWLHSFLFNRIKNSSLVQKVHEWLLIEILEDREEHELNLEQITYIPGMKKCHHNKFSSRVMEDAIQLIIIVFSIISVYSIAFLVLEFVSFFVEIVCYTLIGIVMNAGQTMKFVSLIFLLVLYGHDSFKSVDTMYIQFNHVIHKLFCERAGARLKTIAKLEEEKQTNTVFVIHPITTDYAYRPDGDGGQDTENDDTDQILRIIVKNGNVKWESRGFLLFLDKKDIPYIPARFFSAMCEMSHHGCPGPVHANFIKALLHFLLIFMFLVLVGVIVMSFGDIYEISSTNQTLAALAGGFLPWILKNVLFKSQAELTLDTNDWKFQCALDAQIRMKQTWPVADIVVVKKVIADEDNCDGDNFGYDNVDLVVLDMAEYQEETANDEISMV